jgi:hypothetical protein
MRLQAMIDCYGLLLGLTPSFAFRDGARTWATTRLVKHTLKDDDSWSVSTTALGRCERSSSA